MYELVDMFGTRVAICEDLSHVSRMIYRHQLNNYSIRAQTSWDSLDSFSNIISGYIN